MEEEEEDSKQEVYEKNLEAKEDPDTEKERKKVTEENPEEKKQHEKIQEDEENP